MHCWFQQCSVVKNGLFYLYKLFIFDCTVDINSVDLSC